MFYSFDDYWKQFGKYQHEVVSNPKELEQVFYSFARKIWDDAEGTGDETFDDAHIVGYEQCEKDFKVGDWEKILEEEKIIKEVNESNFNSPLAE